MSIKGIDKFNRTDTEQTITVILTEKATVNNKVDVRYSSTFSLYSINEDLIAICNANPNSMVTIPIHEL